MTYLSNEKGTELTPIEQILLAQIANLGTPLQYLRVNTPGSGLEYATLPPSASPSIGGAITGGTAGSVLFVSPSGIIAQDNANFFFDNTNKRQGIGTNAPASQLEVLALSMGVTRDATKGIMLRNTTVATVALTQISPAIQFVGQGWKTSSVAGSQTAQMSMYLQPVQGSTNPTSQFFIKSSINGGADVTVAFLGVAVGLSVPGTGTSSQRFGQNAVASNTNSLAVGVSANVSGSNGIGIGAVAVVAGTNATGIGSGVSAAGNNSVAVGTGASSGGSSGTALGANSIASNTNSLAFGNSAQASGTEAVAIGAQSFASITDSIAIGYSANASTNPYAIAIGAYSITTGTDAIALGIQTQALGDYSIALGGHWIASGAHQVLIGSLGTTINTTATTLINGDPSSTGSYNTIVGYLATTSENYTTAIGMQATARGSAATAVGYNSSATGANSAAYGNGASSSGIQGLAMGVSSQASGSYSIAHGVGAIASIDYAIAIGRAAEADFSDSFAIGRTKRTTASDQAVIGYTDTYFNIAGTNSPTPSYIHSGDIFSGVGNTDTRGSDFTIITGLSTGAVAGGDFFIKQSPATGISGDTNTPANTHFAMYADTGRTEFTGETTSITINGPTGALRVNNVYTFPNTDGAAGYGLTTDGSGVVSWQPGVHLNTPNTWTAVQTFATENQYNEIATPAPPPSATLDFYAKTDDRFYEQNNTGTELRVGTIKLSTTDYTDARDGDFEINTASNQLKIFYAGVWQTIANLMNNNLQFQDGSNLKLQNGDNLSLN